jgi:type IV pilus assembly protein PilA
VIGRPHRETVMACFKRGRAQGFTLIELMIVVAIIGVLAAVAIPMFMNYQLTSKRAEAYSNLTALAKSQKAYFAEFNDFVSSAPEPGFSNGDVPTTIKRDMSAIGVSYFDLGWVPEGDVFYDYDTATVADPLNGDCSACVDGCFTASAYGDLDGDGLVAIMIYAHPDVAGGVCSAGYGGPGSPYFPPVSAGSAMVDQTARVLLADDY